MSGKLRVSFNSPQSGFMSIGLKAGDESFVTAVSHEPYDSLRDLIKALSALLGGKERATVKWNQEPEEYDFELRQRDDELELSITRYPNHRRLKKTGEQVFTHTASLLGLCEPFWKALRELHRDIETDEYAKNWRREFPEEEMRELTRLIKSQNRLR